MDIALFLPAVLPFWITVVASHVAPPENVTLDCRNFDNMLKWSYPENTPGLRFEVDIGSYQGTVPTVNTTDLHADVSFLNDPSDAYFVTVTAVVGGKKSKPAPSEDGITFSYYQDNQVAQKCFLDLSPVNITLQRDNKVQISFVHPVLFHRQQLNSSTNKSQKKIIQAEIPAVNFKVTIANQTGKPHSFTCEDQVCNEILPVDAAQQNHCLNITGETVTGPLVKPTQLYCVEAFKEPSPSNFTIVYVVSAVLAVATIGLIICMAYQKMTKPSVSFSNSLVINKSTMSSSMAPTESVHVVSVECEREPSSPTPLLSQTEEEDKTEFTPTCNSTDYHIRLPIGVSSGNGDVSNVTQEGQLNEEGPGYMPGNMDEDDETSSANESPSGYEKRGTVLVDLGQDEMAKGYRG